MKVLIVDEPWSHTPWLMQAFLDRSMQVEVAVNKSGISRCRTIGVRAHVLPDDSPGLPAALNTLLSGPGWDFVVPVSERLMLICAHISSPAIASTLPVAREKLPLLADRRQMAAFVAGMGVDIPPQLPLPDEASIQVAAQRLGWPLVLRGCQGTGSSQVHIANDLSAAKKSLLQLRSVSDGEPFAQAFVAGTIVIVSGLFHEGRVIRAMCSEPVQRWPLPTSPSTVQRTFCDPALEQLTCRLMGALEFSGLASLEWMRRADGHYTFIELNPRSWASLHCARALGIDFAALYAQMLAGDVPVAASDPFSVPAGVELPIFPRYLAAHISQHGVANLLLHPRVLWRGLKPAPWRRPRLLLTLARQLVLAFVQHRDRVRMEHS